MKKSLCTVHWLVFYNYHLIESFPLFLQEPVRGLPPRHLSTEPSVLGEVLALVVVAGAPRAPVDFQQLPVVVLGLQLLATAAVFHPALSCSCTCEIQQEEQLINNNYDGQYSLTSAI